MNIKWATEYASQLLTTYPELTGWTFGIDYGPRSRRFGQCSFGKRRVSLTSWYVELNGEANVADTVKHEIAHALAYVRHGSTGHDRWWRMTCAEVGAVPRRLRPKEEVNMPFMKLMAVCGKCGLIYQRDRVTRGYKYKCRHDGEYLDFKPSQPAVDHAIKTAAQRVESAGGVPATGEIESLMVRLADASVDRREKKKIRARLRSLGHRGGLR